MTRFPFPAWLVVAMVLMPATVVWADCVDGTRPPTPEEQEFGRRLGESLKAALPAAPAPLYLESEPEVILGRTCKDTPTGELGAMVMANYTASSDYADRVKLTIRANHAFPTKDDIVLGTLPKKPAGFKVHNLVVSTDGYKAPYIESVKQAVDRARLQAMIDQPLPATPAPAAWHVGNGQATASASATSPASDAATASSAESPTGTTSPNPGPAQPDVAKKTKDTVNKLRGLLGH